MASRICNLALVVLVMVVACSAGSRATGSGRDTVIYRPAMEQVFQDALRLFEEKNYRQAENGFLRIVNQPDVSHRTTAAYLMAAKAMYHQSEYRSSADLLRRFLSRFRDSEYIDDAQYTLALDYYQMGQHAESADLWLKVSQASTDTALAGRAERMLENVAAANLEIPALQSLLNDARRRETRGFLSVVLAEKILRTGDAKAAREALRPALLMPPAHPRRLEAQAMIDRLDRSGVASIGVVLPLTLKSDQASSQSVGEEMLNGIRLAVDEHNQDAMPKVNLEVRNSERDAGVAAREVSLLSDENQILALIGPVFSNEVIASAGFAAAKGIPLITPTATAPGIAAMGESIFQANPDYVVRGRAMAQYAVLVLGAKRLAVFSASDTANKQIAGAFIREAWALGAEFVTSEFYAPGQTDLLDELARLRQRGMELTEPVTVSFGPKLRPQDFKKMQQYPVPQPVLDSLMVSGAMANVEFLFGPGGARVADSLKIPTQRIRAKYDSLNYPVTGFDAMFVPIAGTEEIGIVSSQLRYFNFQTQLLGTGNWQDPLQLDQNRQYANGIIFSTDTYWEDDNPQVRQFFRQFRARYSKDPDANAMIGYDAMKLLLRALRQGATRREEIIAALSSARPLQGVHSKVNLGPQRVNSFLTLLQYKGRSIRRIGEIDVNQLPPPRNE